MQIWIINIDENSYNIKTHVTRENKSVFQCPYEMSVQMSLISAIKTRGKSSRKPQAEKTCKERVIGRDWMSEKGGLEQAKNESGAVGSKRGRVSAWRRLEDATLRWMKRLKNHTEVEEKIEEERARK